VRCYHLSKSLDDNNLPSTSVLSSTSVATPLLDMALCVFTTITRLRRSVCRELSSVESPARFNAHRTNRHLHVSFRWLVLACMPCNKLSCALQWAGGPSVSRNRPVCASCCMQLTEVGTLTHLHFRTTNAFCALRTTTQLGRGISARQRHGRSSDLRSLPEHLWQHDAVLLSFAHRV